MCCCYHNQNDLFFKNCKNILLNVWFGDFVLLGINCGFMKFTSTWMLFCFRDLSSSLTVSRGEEVIMGWSCLSSLCLFLWLLTRRSDVRVASSRRPSPLSVFHSCLLLFLPTTLLADVQTPPSLWRSDLRRGRAAGLLRGEDQAEGGWDYNLRRGPSERATNWQGSVYSAQRPHI